MSPTVSGTVTDKSGNTASWSTSWTVTGAPTAQPMRVGMSAPTGDWDDRIAEVGPGLKARRIFGDLVSNGRDQSGTIEQAIADGMMPVVSYKVPNIQSAIAGSYDAWATATAAYLVSLNVEIAVCIWHEPMDNMDGPTYVQLAEKLYPFFKGKGKLKVGPILNGFLMTQPAQPAGMNEFKSYISTTLLNIYDYFGIDTYQPGTTASPGPVMPVERINELLDLLVSYGKPNMPVAVGETNGFSALAISGIYDRMLSLPVGKAYFCCVWNTTAARAGILTGTRRTAFINAISDPRAFH